MSSLAVCMRCRLSCNPHNYCIPLQLLLTQRRGVQQGVDISRDTVNQEDADVKLNVDKFIRKDNVTWHRSPWKVKQLRFSKHIMNLVTKGRVEEAREVFGAMKKGKVRAEAAVYNTLIAGYGRQGDARAAFKVFNDMKKHSVLPTDHTYTSIFAACSEAGPKANTILDKVQSELERRGVVLNNIATNALISALASCGRHQDALQTYLDMDKRGVTPDIHTFGSLLLSAGKDGEGGLEVAQRVWSEMRASGFEPDLHSYNMLLQCLRDAGVGESERNDGEEQVTTSLFDLENLKKELDQQSSFKTAASVRVATLHLKGKMAFNLSDSSKLSLFLGATRSGKGPSLRWLERSDIELLLAELQAAKLRPDIRTFHLLVHLTLDPTHLLITMRDSRVVPDGKFMIAAVRMQSQLGNVEGAKGLLQYAKSEGVSVGEKGYQAMARCCRTEEEGMRLLDDMKAAKLVPNEYVFAALLGGAMRERRYEYLTALLKRMLHSEVPPNNTILELLNSLPPPKSPSHRKRYNGFKGYFHIWKGVMCPEEEVD